MEIQALKLLLTEHDLNTIAKRSLEKEQVRDVAIRLSPAGVHVCGVYPTPFMTVRFETLWEVSALSGKIAARLADLKVVGLPAGMLRGAIMSALAEATSKENGLQIDGERLLFDPDRLLFNNGLQVRTNLTAVRCGAGTLLLEAAAASCS
jgi:hypothetical protein